MANDRRKRVVFIRNDYLKEMAAEARRRHWPLSRVAQLAVRIAMPTSHKMRLQHQHHGPGLHKTGEHHRHNSH